ERRRWGGSAPLKGSTMEIKIGVRSVHRELVVETDLSADQVEEEIRKALAADRGVFAITDVKGRPVVVPVASLGFIELGEDGARPVGVGGTVSRRPRVPEPHVPRAAPGVALRCPAPPSACRAAPSAGRTAGRSPPGRSRQTPP